MLNISRTAAVLNAMSNPKRLEALILLTRHEWRVGDLAYRLQLSQSALSQHLGKLRAANLVSTRRDAQVIYYSCNSADVKRVISALERGKVIALYPATAD